MIRQKISPNTETMQELHLKYGWIPGAESIRPNSEIKEKKNNYITNMLTRYVSLQDFVLHRFFGLKYILQGDWNNSRMHVSDTEISSARIAMKQHSKTHEFRLVPNLFSYQVPSGTNHYVIWFLLNGNESIDSTTHSPITDNEINSSIEEALRQLLGSNNDKFSFVWYLNPKPTIISDVLYHVQVFWIP
ncbi:unnamed protein product [Rotaria sp. Silwood1]|nr:unnamed protein product [Rotaria sp. Silwood1]CAF1286529.1 unnamed protein product [Rotaria sp. Silwood1]CAF1291032.1 unnamed protein product [Rotaria sp. Silwood1]CAF3507751.1 unnamed protein product [Rotaria sp. Silwood1]CAF3511694.1 unnamed protein product [Rotaria sp. Silwood1]